MTEKPGIWLVSNASSGSNDDAAIAALEECLTGHGLHLRGRCTFPDEELPTPAALEAAGVECVVVFAGDGTINSLIAGLEGWDGAVLVLPGGTMNLLYHRLHGERSMEEVVALVAKGAAVKSRPGVIRSEFGDAYAGLLAGPGTSWGRVREAMREANVAELAAGTVEAINETLGGEMIACVSPQLGRSEGYPLVMLTPRDHGIEVDGYYAASAAEYLEQTWALLKRNFREGPHDTLGTAQELRLASTHGNPFGILVDGEQAEGSPSVEFTLAVCGVDLLATEADAR
ncbi:MAG: diacylglycerol kinase [Porphyrobacter sp.]|nr:diacylglycerol kinase [Porphyrobacter sp.]